MSGLNSNHYCCVPQCDSWAKRPRCSDINSHHFPRENDCKVSVQTNLGSRESMGKCRVWIYYILKIGKPISKYMKVCYLHFTKEDYFKPSKGNN